ncbi:MAG: tRNA nucleotidyltransferase, CC-adding [Anaerolineae bacterium]|nr:MAG: tRNA nucleotidyltransferase, CC-adding [Anaerolineae bacterium]
MDALLRLPLIEAVRGVAGETSVYLVGGAVRDGLLGKPITDFDFVVSKNALQIARQVANALGGAYYPLDVQRQYGRVIWVPPNGGRIKLDFALQVGETIEEDLHKRDFTTNAIAIDLHNPQQLIDPLQGAQAILTKTLRACSDDAFRNDPLRVIRGVRFALTLNFRIEPSTWRAMVSASPGLVIVSAERKAEELFRLLASHSVASSIRLLDRVGALPHTFPELLALRGVEQSPPHRQDVYQHTLEVLNRLEEILSALSLAFDEERQANLILGMASLRLGRYRARLSEYLAERFTPEREKWTLLFLAALYHDTGKASTASKDEKGRWRFFGHEQVSAELFEERGRQLAIANDEIEWVRKVILHHMRPILLTNSEGLPSRRAVYRFFRQTGEAGIGVCYLSLADLLGIYGFTMPVTLWSKHLDVTRELLQAWWEEKETKISPLPLLDGNEVMQKFGLKPSPLVGKVLEGIREAQAAGEVHSKAEALRLAEQIITAGQASSQER